MIFYGLLIIITILIILYDFFKYLKRKQKVIEGLQKSFDDLQEQWNNFKWLF